MYTNDMNRTDTIGVLTPAGGCAKSAVSWPAIFAGAVVASSISLGLLLLGSSFGLAMISPWSGQGVSATGFTVHAALWLIIMQWVSSGVGGYMTGRLRTAWSNLHTHEVFFRDTAHGFLAWSVATLVMATMLASAAGHVIGGGAQAIGMGAMGAAHGAASAAAAPGGHDGGMSNPVDYYVDMMNRAPHPTGNDPASNAEEARIIGNYAVNGDLSDDDKSYLAQRVAARTGISQAEATDRVNATVAKIDDAKAKAKADADKARKTAAKAAIYTFLSLLIGAIIACLSAAHAGRVRDMGYGVTTV